MARPKWLSDDGEPAQLTQPKGKDKDGNPAKPIEIPVPKVSTFRAALRKVAQPLKPGPPGTK